MTIYTWGDHARITRLETLPFGKKSEAILHADADAETLPAIRNMFTAMGIAAFPDTVEGESVLRLRGFRDGEFIAQALERNGFVAAENRQIAPSEKKKGASFVDKIRSHSVTLSGWIYMIGDAALIVSGHKRGDKNEVLSGIAYGAVSVATAGWGHRKPEKVFDDLYSRMLGEFAKEGVKLPEGAELTAKELGKPGGILSRMEKFLYDYPTQIFTAGNAIAGFNLFRAGVNQGNNDKKIAGALVMTGMLTALLVPEKSKKDNLPSLDEMAAQAPNGADAGQVWRMPEADKPKGILGMLKGARDWVQERPLRVGGYLAMINNAFMVKGALNERQTNPAMRNYLSHLQQGDAAGAADFLEQAKQDDKLRIDKRLTKKDFEAYQNLNPDSASFRERVGKLQSSLEAEGMSKAEAAKSARVTVGVENRAEIDKRLHSLEQSDGMWKMNILAAASYLVANGLLSISSTKGSHGGGGSEKGGEGKKDPNEELYAAAAAIIANQPEEVQETVITKMAAFLASQREIDASPQELADKMREKVATVKDSPWLDPAKHPDRAPSRHSTASRVPDYVPEEWVRKEALRDAAAKDSGLTGAAR